MKVTPASVAPCREALLPCETIPVKRRYERMTVAFSQLPPWEQTLVPVE